MLGGTAQIASNDVQISKTENPIRVMLVDDSSVVRGLIARMVTAEPGMEVVSSVCNGQLAVSGLARAKPDVVVLDIEMPVMDGLTALPKLLEADPTVKVVMASTLTHRNAEVTMRALNAGAADYLPKPSAARDLGGTSDFRRELINKIRNLANVRRHVRKSPPIAASEPGGGQPRPDHKDTSAEIALRPVGVKKPEVLAIGSSTGGPQALMALIKCLGHTPKFPVFITQHMPVTFTEVLANHISKSANVPCAEAQDGELVVPGRIYLARGGQHMVVRGDRRQHVIRLDDSPPENFCRPSVDPMLRSLVHAYDGAVLTVILTGMGADGLEGTRSVVQAGGTAIAQDEATSVVWGMPGAVATAGICSAVLPLPQIARTVLKVMGPGR